MRERNCERGRQTDVDRRTAGDRSTDRRAETDTEAGRQTDRQIEGGSWRETDTHRQLKITPEQFRTALYQPLTHSNRKPNASLPSTMTKSSAPRRSVTNHSDTIHSAPAPRPHPNPPPPHHHHHHDPTPALLCRYSQHVIITMGI